MDLEEQWPSITTNESLEDVSTMTCFYFQASPSSDGPTSKPWPQLLPPPAYQSIWGAWRNGSAEVEWPSFTSSDAPLEDEWPSITTNESLEDVSTNESASVFEASPSSDGPTSEALWPAITPPAAGHQSDLGGLEDVVPAEEEWPSITTSDAP